MKFFRFNLVVVLCFFSAAAFGKSPTPCVDIDRGLSDKEKLEFARPVAAQLKKDIKEINDIEVLKSFRYKRWRILYVNTKVTDEAYVFYSADPATHPYITLWSGAARMDEEDEIYNWLVKNAKDIPTKLAHCFSWHVTKDPSP